MTIEPNLQRFIKAQETDFAVALSEVRNGKKRSHWMWYIFPQIQGLGHSEMSRIYSLKNLDEAVEYLRDPVLGKRLIQISTELLKLESDNATAIFGGPDDMKLKSSMTLFAVLSETDPIFERVLGKFYGGVKDERTLRLLNQ